MRKLLMESDQAWHLTNADHAASGPKVHQHDLASQALLAQALSVDQPVGDRWRSLRCEPEAPAQKTQAGQERQTQNDPTRPMRPGRPARQNPHLPDQADAW